MGQEDKKIGQDKSSQPPKLLCEASQQGHVCCMCDIIKLFFFFLKMNECEKENQKSENQKKDFRGI